MTTDINDKDSKLRSLAWTKARTPNSGLDWILESSEDFTVGRIERDKQGYLVKVRDVYKNQEHNVYLEEEDLRKDDFSTEMMLANQQYEDKLSSEKLQKETRKRKRLHTIKRVLQSAVVLAGLGFGGKYAYQEYNKPERVVARQEAAKLKAQSDLETRAENERQNLFENSSVEIAKQLDQQEGIMVKNNMREYALGNGDKVKIGVSNYESVRDSRLYLELSNKVRFFSETWGDWDSPSHDAENVEYVEIKEGDKWIRLTEIPQERKNQYKNLILEIAQIDKRQ